MSNEILILEWVFRIYFAINGTSKSFYVIFVWRKFVSRKTVQGILDNYIFNNELEMFQAIMLFSWYLPFRNNIINYCEFFNRNIFVSWDLMYRIQLLIYISIETYIIRVSKTANHNNFIEVIV